MGTDQFIELLSDVCLALLPVAGFVLLVYLIILVKNIIKTLKQVNVIIDDCDKQVRKLDKPLDTINHVSETVDNIHDATKSAVSSAAAMIISNSNKIVDWVKQKNHKVYDSVKEEADDVVHEREA